MGSKSSVAHDPSAPAGHLPGFAREERNRREKCDSDLLTSISCRGPGSEGAELKLFQDALDQVELADRLGIDYAWEVEHHFLEEYSHSSAPEVFLAAALAAHEAASASATASC